MNKDFEDIYEIKSDIVSKLYQKYPDLCVLTEKDYGCYLFDSPDLYLQPDSIKTKAAIRQSSALIQAFHELKCEGVIHCKRINHMGWSAELTRFGYQHLHQLYPQTPRPLNEAS